ncbi:glycosyltransferase involved in cell wall biosynthesis [Buttiauxella sp. BIGb0471]|uniref:glycosyltransferase n=1 Tax=Buttiauxella sp. BIGb0471 TaxID=2940597 RepID=UPI00216A9893|nr:glycosyltransferase [Buttiauxella sp. BIGb0471]MCS3601274.1 glycosyltransferase involved in cell wall biosynthesis [Buttiauxella sp. BIGb0471]
MRIKKLLLRIESQFVRLKLNHNELANSLSRDQRDVLTLKNIESVIENRKKHPSISAVYRVRNGSQYIELSIISVAPICSEIIIVDNGSTDGTLEIVKRLKDELSSICDIKIFHYNSSVALAGKGYRDEVEKYPERSLAKYYNYAFSLASCEYVMKCDAHCIYTPAGINKIQSKIINLYKTNNLFTFRGVEIFGGLLSCEPYLIKKGCFEYYDSDTFELLKLKFKRSFKQRIMGRISTPCFIHVKRMSYVKYAFKKESTPIKYLYSKGE